VSWKATTDRLRGGGPTALVAALAIVTLATGSALFAESDQARRAIDTAYSLQRSEETLVAMTALRGSLAVSLLAGDAWANDRLSETERNAAVGDLTAISAGLSARVEQLAGTHGALEPVVTLASDVRDSVDAVADSVRSGELDAAQSVAERETIISLERLEAEVGVHRANLLTQLEQERGRAGTSARAASVVVTLVVPAVALTAYRRMQKRRERSRELHLALLHQEEQAALKDQMIANLSHQLRTPLTGIYGMAAAMLEYGFDDADFSADATHAIFAEADDLSRMVDDLLVATKLDTSEIAVVPQELDPRTLIDEVVAASRTPEPIVVDCVAGLVAADRVRLRQVLRNLISNAITFGDGDRQVEGVIEGDRYRISIIDHGAGMPPESEDRMFTRFMHSVSGHVATGSMGLGLAIAAELSELMGLDLAYRREAGVTAFDLVLPVVAVREPAPDRDPISSGDPWFESTSASA